MLTTLKFVVLYSGFFYFELKIQLCFLIVFLAFIFKVLDILPLIMVACKWWKRAYWKLCTLWLSQDSNVLLWYWKFCEHEAMSGLSWSTPENRRGRGEEEVLFNSPPPQPFWVIKVYLLSCSQAYVMIPINKSP